MNKIVRAIIILLCLIAISQIPYLIGRWQIDSWQWWAIDVPLIIVFTIIEGKYLK
jgi:hypothetical protein